MRFLARLVCSPRVGWPVGSIPETETLPGRMGSTSRINIRVVQTDTVDRAGTPRRFAAHDSVPMLLTSAPGAVTNEGKVID